MASVKLFDMCVAKPKSDPRDGVWWHRIGRASENSKGQISLFFDSLPYPDKDGRCQAMLFESKDREDQPSRSSSSQRRATVDADDDIPL